MAGGRLRLKGARVLAVIGLGAASVVAPLSVGIPAAQAAACTPTETTFSSGGTTFMVLAFKQSGSCEWTVPTGVTSLDYLVVGAGGGGGSRHAGGGGAGGFLEATSVSIASGTTLAITVGGGGSGGSQSPSSAATNGGNSSIAGTGVSVTAVGGGAGKNPGAAGSGGSGGGSDSLAPAGAATSGQGSAGGLGLQGDCFLVGAPGSDYWCGGGGGGAGGAGGVPVGNSASAHAGDGGAGRATVLLDATAAAALGIGEPSGGSVYFAGGGGGAAGVQSLSSAYAAAGGARGLGGGGAGATLLGTPASGTANTGGGGGAGGYQGTGGVTGGSGGSGVVIIRYVAPPSAPTLDALTPGDGTLGLSATLGAAGGAAITRVDYSLDGGTTWISSGQATGSFIISGLINGTSYSVQVRAANTGGVSPASNAASGTPRTVPGAPTGVTATAGDASITVAWSAPASDGGSAIGEFVATASPGGQSCATSALSCTITGLTNGTAYTVTVVASNAAGSGPASSPSASVTPVVPPAPPAPPAPTPTPTPTPTPSPTPSATATVTPPEMPTPTPTRTATPRPTASETASPEETLPAGEPTKEPTAEPTTASPAPTESPAPTPEETNSAPVAAGDESGAPTPEPSPSGGAVPTPVPEPSPTPTPGSIFTDTGVRGPALTLTVDLEIGASATGRRVTVVANGLLPGSPVQVNLYSEPTIIGSGVADAAGSATLAAVIPSGLPPGIHSLEAVGTAPDGTPVQSIGAFEIEASQTVTAFAPPGQTATRIEPGSPELERALAAGKPIFDQTLYPATTAAVTVAAVSLLGLAGIGGLAGMRSAGQPGGTRGRGKLAAVVTKKLKSVKADEPGAGDRSRIWNTPGTTRTDAWIAAAPVPVGHYSALMPRLLVDGAWSRAMFGSFAFVLWGVGIVLGLIAATSVDFQPFPPALPMALAIIILGILDAAAGVLAWMVLVVGSTVAGNVTTWDDVRTLLGIFVLYATLPLLAHAIRPLRRRVTPTAMDKFDRVCDYIMMPFFVAFAASSMYKALNGLSGLELTNPDDLWTVRITVILACWVRLAAEDLSTHVFPVRSAEVQPAKLVSPGRPMALASVAVRTAVYILIAIPFFGFGWVTLLSAGLLAVPMVLKVWEDDLPNAVWLNKWFPRGLTRFALLLVLGVYLSAWILGQEATDEQVRQTFTILLLPGIIAAVIELFGREGGIWPETWLKRVGGGVLWLLAAGITAGVIVLA